MTATPLIKLIVPGSIGSPSSYRAGRPFKGPFVRHHGGVDLQHGADVVKAPWSGAVTYFKWPSATTKNIYGVRVESPSGLRVLIGGLLGSHQHAGTHAIAGETLGVPNPAYNGGRVHVQVYTGKRPYWNWQGPEPENLFNPMRFSRTDAGVWIYDADPQKPHAPPLPAPGQTPPVPLDPEPEPPEDPEDDPILPIPLPVPLPVPIPPVPVPLPSPPVEFEPEPQPEPQPQPKQPKPQLPESSSGWGVLAAVVVVAVVATR